MLSGPLDKKVYLGRVLDYSVPPNLQRTWWVDHRIGQYLEKCHVEARFASKLLAQCLGVAPGDKGTVYMIGDSHARNYLAAKRNEFRDYSIAYLTMGHGCALVPPELSALYSEYRCSEYLSATTRYLLENAQIGDTVVIGQRLMIDPDRRSPLYVDFIAEFADRLGEKGVSVVLLDGTAPPELDPVQCLDLPWSPLAVKDACSRSWESVVAAFADFDRLAQKAARERPNLYYAPLRTSLCHGGTCGQTSATGASIWHDRGHITDEVVAELTQLLHARLVEPGFYDKAPSGS